MSRISFAISVLVAVVSVVAFAACGGSDDSPLSEDEYFDRLGEITILSESMAEAAELAGDAPPDLEGHEAWAEWMLNSQVMSVRALVDAYPDLIKELEAIQPPDILRDVHALYLSATSGVSLASAEVLANLERLESFDEMTDAVWRPFHEVGDQQIEACLALEDASAGGFSCLPGGVCFESVVGANGVSRDTVVACSSDGTIGNELCIGFFADFDDAQQGKLSGCSSGGATINIVPGISGQLSDMPPLPAGLRP